MEQEKMNIQWYPGHMTKTRRQIEADLKLVDAVCEIVDARIPISSRNPDIDAICGNKPRIIVLNRMDLADNEATKKCSECGRRLKVVLTKEEQEELTKQNDDMVAINTMMPM